MAKKRERPSWDEYFMGIAELVGKRSTCLRRQVGSVAVMNRRILTTGYNGALPGLEHCGKTGCIREKNNIPSGERHELCRGVHAEQNCVIQAAIHGIKLGGATMYVTTWPCAVCAKMIIAAGFKKLIYDNPPTNPYKDDLAAALLKEAKIKLINFSAKRRRKK